MQKSPLGEGRLWDRLGFLTGEVTGKKVLHLGCADSPYHREHYEKGQLLHALLARAARQVVGVDLDRDAIEFLRKAGYSELVVGDIEHLSGLQLGGPFDVVVAGEIIEHLGNPLRCLAEIRSVLAANGALLITVPNAFSFKSFMRALLGTELVHPDHFFYFSPMTIRRLLEEGGFVVDEIGVCISYSERPLKRLFDRTVLGTMRWFSPWLADGLIIKAHVKP